MADHAHILPAPARRSCRAALGPALWCCCLTPIGGAEPPATPPPSAVVQGSESEFVELFDGKTFERWDPDEELKRLFRIEDGQIAAGGLTERIEHTAYLCTVDNYADFELRLEARLTGQGQNAGVQFRTTRLAMGRDVVGYQCEMGVSHGRLIWGGLYDQGRRQKFLAEGDQEQLKAILKPNDWNHLVIRCQGQRIQIWVNGYQTVDYTENDDKVPRLGIIGLQIHSGAPSEVRYRRLELKDLSRREATSSPPPE